MNKNEDMLNIKIKGQYFFFSQVHALIHQVEKLETKANNTSKLNKIFILFVTIGVYFIFVCFDKNISQESGINFQCELPR